MTSVRTKCGSDVHLTPTLAEEKFYDQSSVMGGLWMLDTSLKYVSKTSFVLPLDKSSEHHLDLLIF